MRQGERRGATPARGGRGRRSWYPEAFMPLVRLPAVRRARVRSRGFTLTELMVVVMLVGVLAVIGIASFRKEVSASRSVEVAAVVQALRAAQESYRAEHHVYLNASESGTWYPVATFDGKAYPWRAGYSKHDDGASFRALNVQVSQPVVYRYRVNAGVAGDTLPDLEIEDPNWGTPTEPWYVIQAKADADGDEVYSRAVASSFTGELYLDNEGE